MFTEPGDLTQDATLMLAVRHLLHANPELGFAERRTSETLAGLLNGWGFDVIRQVGGTGIVASLANGAGRCIGLRAELDALPLRETSGAPHASRTETAMHACGHDGHMAMLLAAGRYLARSRNFSGTVRLIFQPAEEGLGGAARMLEDGLLERFPCDALFALHNAPDMRAGSFATRAGIMAAAGDWHEVTITTRGGHAAAAGRFTDAVVIAASVVMALQTIVARRVDPFEPAIVHVGALQAGSAAGIAADHARLLITVRTLGGETRARVLDAVRALILSQVESHGGQVEIEAGCAYPPLVNTAEETRFAIDVAREVLGDAQVISPRLVRPMMSSDDFGVLLQNCPGCYFLLGTQGDQPMQLHTSDYDFNDACLQTGAALLARLAERYLPSNNIPN